MALLLLGLGAYYLQDMHKKREINEGEDHATSSNQLFYHKERKLPKGISPPTAPLETDRQEKTFTGQGVDPNIRLPFGPNPNYKYIQSTELLHTYDYNKKYQQNLFNNQITQPGDWRLDPDFNSSKNQYTQSHMPEASVGQILNSYNHTLI